MVEVRLSAGADEIVLEIRDDGTCIAPESAARSDAACFGASQNVTAGSIEEAGWFVSPAPGALGLGTLLWLVGSFLFLNGAMDSDPEGRDLHF